MGDGNESRALIDGGAEAIRVDRDAVVARHDHHSRAQSGRQLVVRIAHAGKIELRHDHGVARCRIVERAENGTLRERHRRRHCDLAGSGADEWCKQIARAKGQLPPARGPGAHTARGPFVRVLAQPFGNRPWHGAERIRHEIGRMRENGEFLAEAQQRVVRHRRSAVAGRVGSTVEHHVRLSRAVTPLPPQRRRAGDGRRRRRHSLQARCRSTPFRVRSRSTGG